METRKVFLEILKINRDRSGVFEGQAFLEVPDESRADVINVHLSPIYGPFEGGHVIFQFNLPADFPQHPPSCKALTKIFHPNVSFSGSVCFNLFSSEWKPGMSLSTYVVGLLWFLQNPNNDSPLNSTCVVPESQYKELVQKALVGLEVKGEKFEPAMSTSGTAKVFIQLAGKEYLQLAIGTPVDWTDVNALFENKYSDLCPKDDLFLNMLSVFKDGQLKKLQSSRRRPIRSVKHRADLLDASASAVLKEVVFLVHNKPLLVLTGGYDRVDALDLASVLDVAPDDVVFPTLDQLKEHKIDVNNLSVFTALADGHNILLNERILEHKEVYVHAGDQLFVRTAPSMIYVALKPENYFSASLDKVEPSVPTGVLTSHQKRASYYFSADVVAGMLEQVALA